MQNRPHLARHVSALTLGLLSAAGACAGTLNTQLVASGFSSPVYATAPLAGGPVFVVEKGGTIKTVLGGSVSTFLTVPVNSGGERGLLGLAFDPGYGVVGSAGYGRFFVNYIDPTSLDTVVASYRVSSNPLLADPSTRVEVLRVDQPAGLSNHKAGWLGFKPGDANSLYIATGDGGSGNDPSGNGQNRNTLLGKMLRVNINGDDFADANINYAVPTDNPFFGQAGVRGEIFAYGLRNPWRNSFDRANGNLWIADVGQGAREEVDFIGAASAGGQNFGWRVREGDIATPGVGGPLQPGMVDPLLVYGRSFGSSITGGYVVRDADSPLFGQYIFGDFVSGRIWAVAGDGTAQSMTGATELTALLDAGAGGALGNIASFGEGAGGEIFVVDFDGKVVRLVSEVPEPSTWALWLAGGAAVAGMARRRRGAGQHHGASGASSRASTAPAD